MIHQQTSSKGVSHQLSTNLGGLIFLIYCSHVFADGGMGDTTQSAQEMQSKLPLYITMPFTYNYNRNLGNSNNTNQGEFELQPFIPLRFDDGSYLILNPMLTGNAYTQKERVTNQTQLLQLATYYGLYSGSWRYGIGPYYQSPSSNSNGGSKQSGLGISYGASYKINHWNIGGTGYNSWGVGDNLSAGTANIFSASPSVSYTSDDALTYNLGSAVNYNWNARRATNQLTLSGGKTIEFWGYPIQIQIGPTYMITSTPLSAKGWGAFFGLTGLIKE